MNIINNYINTKYPIIQNQPFKKNAEKKLIYNNTQLPSVNTIGQSLVKKTQSYSLIDEIVIPGLKDKARVYKLSNGQRIVIAQKKGPTFVHTTYNVGSMNEPDNIRGMSHYIEHNLFNGSEKLLPKEYDEKVSSIGGSTNASTNFVNTDYHLQLQLLQDNSLEEAIKLNSLQTQYPAFINEQLEKEKGPVKSEINMCEDNPDITAFYKTIKNLFNIKTSSENFIIGTKENIDSFTRDMVLDYYNKWYTPDNAVTVISGDVNPDETIKLAAKYYNKTHKTVNNRYYEPLKYNDKPIREDIIKPNTTRPSAMIGFAIKEGTSNVELNKLDLLFSLLNSSNSEFNKQLDKCEASFEITVENMQNKPNGAKAIVFAVYAPEEHIENAIKIVYREISKISNNPPSNYVFNNLKKSYINKLLSATENSQNLNDILTKAVLNNNNNYILSTINNVNCFNPYDICEAASNYLDLNKASICVSHSSSVTNETITKNYNKSISFGAKISPLNSLNEEISKIKQYKLPNNIESSVIDGNPYAKSVMRIKLNTDELNSISSGEFLILNEMLNRGSILRSAHDFNDILNAKDIELSFNSDVDGLNITSEFDSANLSETINLVKEKLLYPNFTEEEFLRAKQLVKHSIQLENISAFNKLYQECFSGIKQYEDKEIRLKELDKVTLNDIKQLYAKILSSSSVQALMAAPIESNPNLINEFNNQLVSNMPVFKPFTLERGAGYNTYKPNEKEKVLTDVREQSQAEIVQGYKFKNVHNIDDIVKINLLDMILGSGSMSSRLFLDLREDKKLAYSVGSCIVKEKDTGIMCLRISTTTSTPDLQYASSDNIKKSIEGFNRNIERLKNEFVSEKELQNVKNIYKTKILDKLETNYSKSQGYLNSKYTYYGIDYSKKLLEAIDRVTAQDIKSAANYVFKNPPVTSIVASKKTLDDL